MIKKENPMNIKEYTLTLSEVRSLGSPIFETSKDISLVKKCINAINKQKKFDTIVSSGGDFFSWKSYYDLRLGIIQASLSGIELKPAKRVAQVSIKLTDILGNSPRCGVTVELPIGAIESKDSIDNAILSAILTNTARKNIKWWDFLRFSEGNTVILEYSGETVGYRFKMYHKMLVPLNGEFNLDIDIDSARKIGYRPHTFNKEELKVVNGEFVTDYEVKGKHAFDISQCVQVCKDLAVFMYD